MSEILRSINEQLKDVKQSQQSKQEKDNATKDALVTEVAEMVIGNEKLNDRIEKSRSEHPPESWWRNTEGFGAGYYQAFEKEFKDRDKQISQQTIDLANDQEILNNQKRIADDLEKQFGLIDSMQKIKADIAKAEQDMQVRSDQLDSDNAQLSKDKNNYNETVGKFLYAQQTAAQNSMELATDAMMATHQELDNADYNEQKQEISKRADAKVNMHRVEQQEKKRDLEVEPDVASAVIVVEEIKNYFVALQQRVNTRFDELARALKKENYVDEIQDIKVQLVKKLNATFFKKNSKSKADELAQTLREKEDVFNQEIWGLSNEVNQFRNIQYSKEADDYKEYDGARMGNIKWNIIMSGVSDVMLQKIKTLQAESDHLKMEIDEYRNHIRSRAEQLSTDVAMLMHISQ